MTEALYYRSVSKINCLTLNLSQGGDINMQYVINCFIIVIAALWFTFAGRHIYFGYKYVKYVRKKYPEKTKDLGFPPDGWFNGFRFLRGLSKDNLADAELARLKTLARSSIKHMLICMAAAFFVPFIILIIGGLIQGLYEVLTK